MTFTILGRCPESGQLGAAVTTSDLAVGARVLHARAGLGVAVTQHRTDPRLGPMLLAQLGEGCTAGEAVAAVCADTPHRDWRQLAALDAAGATAAFSGARVWPISAEYGGVNCFVLANMLTTERVAPAMARGFETADGELADRLLAALQAGRRAGGETGVLRSAALLIVERESFPLVDLRVDAAADPLDALDSLWAAYRPRAREFVARALDPDGVQRSSSTTT